ncbi:MAG TPA: KEOPS complex subunit Cgi121 [Candidatus Methanofastidiosa archaeon]|mgnify:CR=1 FL=1|nr:KEOPS complex subunit Cgi121 [Candidatus Methanofastidiosa archaeon]
MKVFVTTIDNANKLINDCSSNVLIYNPSYVLDKKQAEFAAVLALKAFENGQNIANKLAIEFLVRLSGEKQIKKALAFGMEGLGEIAGIVLLDDEVPDNIQEIPFTPDINMISRKYGVKKKDIEKGIYEKMALVDI